MAFARYSTKIAALDVAMKLYGMRADNNMEMSSSGADQFRKLDWRDSTLHNMRCKGATMSFVMTEHIATAPAGAQELVEVAISGLTYLSVSLAPYRHGVYGTFEKPLTMGSVRGNSPMEFEGKMLTNPFSKTVGEYFWVAIDFSATAVEVKRTGRFIEASTANTPILGD